MKPSSRLDRLPPYLFAELERKVSEKKAAGVDVISLGIGDPDTPTPEPVVEALARFYERRFGVTLDPGTEIVPALGAKECVFNLNLAFLDPDSIALAADPGYPVYTGGPLLAGAEAVLLPLVPERGSAPASCTSTTRTTRPGRWRPRACSSAQSSSAASTGC